MKQANPDLFAEFLERIVGGEGAGVRTLLSANESSLDEGH